MIGKHLLNDVVFCNENDSILEVSRILRDTKSRHLIIIDSHKKPLGIISTVDINNRVIAEAKDPAKTLAKQIMSKPIQTIEVSSTCEEAYKKMIEHETYSMPVTENGILIGSLSFNKIFGRVC